MNLDKGRKKSINRRHSDRIRTRPRSENDVPDDGVRITVGRLRADQASHGRHFEGGDIGFAAWDRFRSPVLRDVPVVAGRIRVPSGATRIEPRSET